MLRIALYSDVHGNIRALEAVLTQIEREGLTERYCLGDLVGLGPRPSETVRLVRSLGDQVVQGNYDRAIGLHLSQPGSEFATPQEELDGAESYGFTVSEIDGEEAAFLHALPCSIRIEHQGARIVLCHGTPGLANGVVAPDEHSPVVSEIITRADADAVCAGHTHVPFHRALPVPGGVQHWVNAGSVGRPRDGDPRAAWVELVVGTQAEVVARAPADIACRRIGGTDLWLGAVTHRVIYSVDAVIRDMAHKGLPHTLAAALRTGYEEHDQAAHEDPPSAPAPSAPVKRDTATVVELPCGHSSDSCSCLYDDRTAAYDSLARLFRGEMAEVAAAVRRLRIAMRTCKVNRHVDEEAILAAYEGADLAFRTVGGREAFAEERERLFGMRGEFDPFVNVLSPQEGTYRSGDVQARLAGIEDAYAEGSFTVPEISQGLRVADHISTELSFMAHCLRGASAGDPHALERAHAFFTEHLAEWAVLFAVVVGQQAREPVMQYAGLALDKFLACEGSIFRHFVPVHEESRVAGPGEETGGGMLSFISRRR